MARVRALLLFCNMYGQPRYMSLRYKRRCVGLTQIVEVGVRPWTGYCWCVAFGSRRQPLSGGHPVVMSKSRDLQSRAKTVAPPQFGEHQSCSRDLGCVVVVASVGSKSDRGRITRIGRANKCEKRGLETKATTHHQHT